MSTAVPFTSRAPDAMLRRMAGVRIGRLDVVLAAGLTALGLLLMAENVADARLQASPLAIPAFVAATLPLLWRSAAPRGALLAFTVAVGLHVAVFGEAVRCGVVFPVAFLLVFAAGARLERPEALQGLGLGLAAVTLMTLDDGQVGPEVLPFFGPLTAAVWGLGRLVHSRSRLARELEARTAELRRARDDRARMEVATDRARLSAELDGVLQRRLGDLGRLARAGRDEPLDPDAAIASLAAIERQGRRTLEEMRAVVGVLRDDATLAPTAPQPTLRHLEALLARAEGAGARLQVEGNPRVLPAGVELSAYRVVEHLLDALDGTSEVRVRVRFGDTALELAVSGPVRRRGQVESAIERARERVELHRGTLVADLRDGRAEAVAQLPVALAGV